MSERRQLINLAYRLLGSLAEAEDAVQETYARWYAMSGQQQDAIESPGAWLTTVASRICLDLLGSARARRERYVGEWIPEPLPDHAEWIGGRPGGTTADPADRVTLDESVNMAFLVVLESMTPAERVAFILHDVFRYSFAEVADIVGRTPAACRQLASSARRRIRASQPPATPAAQQASVIRDFKQAWEAKDISALIGLLDPGATATGDGGGLVSAGLRPIEGAEQIARFFVDPPPCGTRPDAPGTHRQRPARPGRSAGRRHRDGVRVRHRRRPDQAHLGNTQPRQAPALDDGLTNLRGRRSQRARLPPRRRARSGAQTHGRHAGAADTGGGHRASQRPPPVSPCRPIRACMGSIVPVTADSCPPGNARRVGPDQLHRPAGQSRACPARDRGSPERADPAAGRPSLLIRACRLALSDQQLRALGMQHCSGDEAVADQEADGVGDIFRPPDLPAGQPGGHVCKPRLFHLR